MAYERVKKALTARGLTDKDVVDRLNREVIPVLIELRQRFNELNLSPTSDPYVVTNPVDRRSFDTTTVTLSELAEVVGTLISDLQALDVIK